MSDSETDVKRSWQKERMEVKSRGRGLLSLLPEDDLRRILRQGSRVAPGVVPGQFEDADVEHAYGRNLNLEGESPRLWNGLRRDSPCPAPDCGRRDRKLKKHSIGAHLSPLFTDVPTNEQMVNQEFHTRRMNVVKDLARLVLKRRDATPF